MTDLLKDTTSILNAAGFGVDEFVGAGRRCLVFENSTVLGFVFPYDTVAALLADWEKDLADAVNQFRTALRLSGAKAWNTYALYLTADAAADFQPIALTAIEENLSGTRKVARANVTSIVALESALLPLIPLRSAPRLDAVDFMAEIRLRTQSLSPRVTEAFLTLSIPEAALLELMGDA